MSGDGGRKGLHQKRRLRQEAGRGGDAGPFDLCYEDYVRPYFKDRWVDYAQNAGKTSGGFCASPYRIHPFILLSWTGELSEVFTLVHELGHGAHFGLAQQEQSFFNQDISMYLVEAPSK